MNSNVLFYVLGTILCYGITYSSPVTSSSVTPLHYVSEFTKKEVQFENINSTVSSSPTSKSSAETTPTSKSSTETTPTSKSSAETTSTSKSSAETTSTTTAVVPTPTKTTPPPTETVSTTKRPVVTTPEPLSTTTNASILESHFNGPSFIGGIVLTVGLTAIGFIAFKFYKSGKLDDGNHRTVKTGSYFSL